MCEQKNIRVNTQWTVSWQRGTMIIVVIDVLITVLYVLGVMRIRFY